MAYKSLPLQNSFSGYLENCKTGVIIPPATKQINLYSAWAVNGSGLSIDVGICKKLGNDEWKAYSIIAANTPDATDVTASIQAGTATNIFTTTINDGFMIGAKQKFGVIGLTVSQADSGSPVYAIRYYNGSAMATLTGYSIPASYAAGTVLITFPAPIDWVPGSTAAVGGDSSLYMVEVVATTAGGQIVKATSAWICQFLAYTPGLADRGYIQFDTLSSDYPLVLSGNQQVLPYFGGTANAKNTFGALFSIQG